MSDWDRAISVLLGDPHDERGAGLARLIEPDGHVVRRVDSADDVFSTSKQAPPDLILLSTEIDGGSVFELCSDLRAAETKGSYTPIVLVSPTLAEERIVEQAVHAGADDVVCFPGRPIECRARVAAQARHKRRHDMLPMILDEARQLQQEATIDGLTGLLNRKSLVAVVQACLDRSDPFAILFVDLDRFKSVNDTYGHAVGDEVLKATSDVLKNGTRHGDHAGRMGGEEFVVLLAGADEDAAIMVAERLRTMVEALTFPPEGYPPRVTASIGIGVCDPSNPDRSVDAILERADTALYQAKHRGRNRYVVAEPRASRRAPPAAVSEPPPSKSDRPSRDGANGAPRSGGVAENEAAAAPASAPPRSNGASEHAAGSNGEADGDDELEVFRREVEARLASGRVGLPQLPAVAAEALQLVNDPDGSIAQLVELVEKDPPIAARLVALANSAIYARGTSITDVRGAVGRLGMTNTRDLLLQVVYASTMMDVPKYKKQVTRTFKRGVLCGVAARALCRALKEADGYAYIAGLIHDIGEARMYKILSSLGKTAPKEEAIVDALVARYHQRAGAELAAEWSLPDEIVDAARSHHEDPDTVSRPVQIVVAAAALVDELVAETDGEEIDAAPHSIDLPAAVVTSVKESVRDAMQGG